MASSVDTSELPPALANLVLGLASLPDDKYRYKQLLFWAGESDTMPEALKTPENRVPGCLSTVHVHAELADDGTVNFIGDSDAQLTKGLVTLLVKGLSGSTPETIADVQPGFIQTAGIAQSEQSASPIIVAQGNDMPQALRQAETTASSTCSAS